MTDSKDENRDYMILRRVLTNSVGPTRKLLLIGDVAVEEKPTIKFGADGSIMIHARAQWQLHRDSACRAILHMHAQENKSVDADPNAIQQEHDKAQAAIAKMTDEEYAK
jgi:hypothetical protein